MKNSIFYLITFISSLCAHTLVCCPQGFSATDQRPFFEQYDVKNNPVEKTEKEEQ